MDTLTTKSVHAVIRAVNEENHSVEAVLSSASIDRMGESITQDGWDLSQFKSHPVLVSSHDYGGGMLGGGSGLKRQIGEWRNVRVEGGELVGEAVYYVGKGNEEADWGWELAKMGAAAYSVGFMPRAYSDHPKGDGVSTPTRTYEKQELIETSHVIVPANADALAKLSVKGIGAASESAQAVLRSLIVGKGLEDIVLTEDNHEPEATPEAVLTVTEATFTTEEKEAIMWAVRAATLHFNGKMPDGASVDTNENDLPDGADAPEEVTPENEDEGDVDARTYTMEDVAMEALELAIDTTAGEAAKHLNTHGGN
jgi:hypothetical protein